MDSAANPEALRSRTVRSGAITLFRYGGSQLIRLAANILVTRLVAPEAMGLMNLVNVLVQGLEMFSDLGTGLSIISSKRGDDKKFLDTVWTVQLLRGGSIWAIACVCAIPFSLFYDEPLLRQMIPVAGLNALLASLAPTKQWSLNRHLQLGLLTIQELLAQVLGLCVMIGLAYVWHSVWALVYGSLAITALKTLFAYLLLPGPNNRLCWEKRTRAELFGFGRWVFVSTILTFLSGSADRLIFGKVLTMEMLGIYGIAKMMASAPADAVGQIGSRALFPYYSRMVTSGEGLSGVFVRARFPLLLLGGFGLSILAGSGDALIDLLYDDRYRSGGWVLQVLAIGAWFNVLCSANVNAFLALGQSKPMAMATAIRTAAIVTLIPLGAHLGGFHGAVIAFAASGAIQLMFSAVVIHRNGIAPLFQDAPMTGLVLASAGAGWLSAKFAASTLSAALAQNSTLVALAHGRAQVLTSAAAVLIGSIVVSLFWLPFGWPLLRKLLARQAVLG
jgi:O-antigen/teichoic acid export membrane protein